MKNIFCPGINFNSIIVAPPSCTLYLLASLAFNLKQLLFVCYLQAKRKVLMRLP